MASRRSSGSAAGPQLSVSQAWGKIRNWIYRQLSMGVDLLPDFIRSHYEVHEYQHACAILRQDFPAEWRD